MSEQQQPAKMWSGHFRKTLLCGVGIASLCLAPTFSAQTYTRHSFTLQNIKLDPGERIIGIDLDIITGKFDQVSPLPAGWHITIDNSADSASHTKFSGDCDLGAAALGLDELNRIIFVISQEPTDRLAARGAIHVISWEKYGKRDPKAERTIPIRISNLHFAERTNK